MKEIRLSRREFLIVAAGTTGAILTPSAGGLVALAAQASLNRFEFKTGVLKPGTWPDGKPVKGGIWVVNGSLPGPTIRVKEGEDVSVTLCNNLPLPTSMHWHGLHQIGTWFMDGVEMISQQRIPPGGCYTYRFKASPAGTHWYHSHTGVQYSMGLFGPLIVEEKKNPYKDDYDYDRVVTINDWFHIPSQELLANLKKGAYTRMDKDKDGSPDVADVPFESALINGKGRFDSQTKTAYEVFDVKSKDRIRFRVINASSQYAFKFAIDGHKLFVIAADGTLTKPQKVDNLIVEIGERYDVILNADRPRGNYWIRAKTLEQDREDYALAVLRYDGVEQGLPKTIPFWGRTLNVLDLKQLTPTKLQKPTTHRELRLSGSMMPYKWMVDGKVFGLPEKPLTEDRNPPDPPTTRMKLKEGDVLRLVINNESAMSHPFHLHGHYFHLLGMSQTGAGKYDGRPLNEKHPLQKDTVSIPGKGWAVIQWAADNPGFWFFHCHIETHLATGMAIMVQEGAPPLAPKNVGQS